MIKRAAASDCKSSDPAVIRPTDRLSFGCPAKSRSLTHHNCSCFCGSHSRKVGVLHPHYSLNDADLYYARCSPWNRIGIAILLWLFYSLPYCLCRRQPSRLPLNWYHWHNSQTIQFVSAPLFEPLPEICAIEEAGCDCWHQDCWSLMALCVINAECLATIFGNDAALLW